VLLRKGKGEEYGIVLALFCREERGGGGLGFFLRGEGKGEI